MERIVKRISVKFANGGFIGRFAVAKESQEVFAKESEIVRRTMTSAVADCLILKREWERRNPA